MTRAFDKACAPGNDEIGNYHLVDNCNFPAPPAPITTPIDPPVPIPPVDLGCYPIAFTGRVFTPGDSSAVAGGVETSVGYVDADNCQPILDLAINVPCFVRMTGGSGTVAYDADASEPLVELDVTGGDDCDFALNLALVLPCPTDIISAGGSVGYDPNAPTGSIEFTTEASPGTCDFDLGLNLTLPCPGEIQATTALGERTLCLPESRRPSISVEVEPLLTSSSEATCGSNLRFDMDIPCPVVFPAPTLRLSYTNETGDPYGQFLVNPQGSSSSSLSCPQDCIPHLDLAIKLPCPVAFETIDDGSWEFNNEDEGTPQPWATEPSGQFSLRLHDGQYCSPILDVSLNLPCPVKLTTDSVDTVNVKDSLFYAEAASPPAPPTRSWAFGQPTALATMSLDSVGGDETECLPILDVSLNLPCPTGGKHKLPVTDDEIALRNYRQSEFYAADTNHPYRDKIPSGAIKFGDIQDEVGTYDDLLNGPDAAPRGNFSRLEFDNNCNLLTELSLWLPCSHRDLDIKLFDFTTGAELTPADGYSVDVHQDWANAGTNPCAFDDSVDLYITQGGGGGGGGANTTWARITGITGAQAPYIYDGAQVAWTPGTGWTTTGTVWNGTLINVPEGGPSGVGAYPLQVGDVVKVEQISASQWAINILHYRGTFR